MFDGIPAGWRYGKLLDFFQLQRGFDLPVQNRNTGSIPIIASNGQVGVHDEAPILAPAVVTGRSGTIGNVLYSDTPCWPLNTTLFVSDFKGSHPRFVYYFLQSFPLKSYATGTGVPTLNRNDVHAVEVCFPPLDEQRRIAEVLRSVDEAIFAARLAADAAARSSRTIRHEILCVTADGEVDEIPADWELKPLETLATVDRGKFSIRPRNDPRYFGGETPFIQTGDITGSSDFLIHHSQTLNDLGVEVSKVWSNPLELLHH
jgi:type I restriction enzyme S subunit